MHMAAWGAHVPHTVTGAALEQKSHNPGSPWEMQCHPKPWQDDRHGGTGDKCSHS